MSYPLPVAEPPEVEKVRALYRTRYSVTLSFDEAKRLLEGVMQFIYLTEIDDALRPLRPEEQRERGSTDPEY
jgi:hypothetical protein